MSDIFVSYKREDRDRVEQLAHALEAEGFSVWWDPELQIGQSYAASIREELNQARAVVPVWTSLSVHSDWVQEEATQGKRRGILFPVRMEAVDPPIGFTMVETADLSDWIGGDASHPEWSRLLEQLRAKLRGASAAPEGTRAAAARALPGLNPGVLVGSRTALLSTLGAIAVVGVIAVAVLRDSPDTSGDDAAPAAEEVATAAPAGPAGPARPAGPALPREAPAPVVAAGANSSIAEARPLALAVAEPGEILATDDTRYYLVTNTLKLRDLVLVRLENLSVTLRPNLKIFNANKSLITELYDGNPGASVEHTLAVDPGKAIYLQVLPYNTTGKYRISVTPQKAYDAYEPNDDLLNPKPIKVGEDISGNIMDGGDHDWFRVSGATGAMISVTFENLSTTLRPHVRVYDRNKSNLLDRFDGTPGANLNFEVNIKQAGDFYLEVLPYSTAGKYRLRLE
jgi:hypothetical protein